MANEHSKATMCSLAALPDVPGLSSRSDLNGLSGTTDGSMQPNIFDLAQLGTSVDKLIDISFKKQKWQLWSDCLMDHKPTVNQRGETNAYHRTLTGGLIQGL